MAVQQNRKTRAKRGTSFHDALTTAALTVDQTSGEIHRRHHVTADGFYRGKKVIVGLPLSTQTVALDIMGRYWPL